MANSGNGTSFDDDLCCRMYEKAKKFGPADMERSALESIIRKTPTILAAKSFLNLSNEAVCGILAAEGLRVQNELDIFKVILRMGHHKCTSNEVERSSDNLRLLLKDVIPLIRFPLMDEQEFQDFVVPSGLLDNSQLDVMSKWFQHKKHNTPPPYMPFSTIPRNFVRMEDGNFCESTCRFADALKTLEDFSATALYSGNVNVVALEGILYEIQKMMLKLAGEIKTTQKDLCQKTGYLEFLLEKSKEELSQTQRQAAANVDSINADLQGTKAALAATNSDLQQTKAQLTHTQNLLNETTQNLQNNIEILDKSTRRNIEETKNELLQNLHIECQRTLENFQDLRKDLRQTEGSLKDGDQILEKKLEGANNYIRQVESELEKTKHELNETKAKLQQNMADLDKEHQELLKEAKNDLNKRIQKESEMTAENFQSVRREVQKTESSLRESDDNLETKLKETKARLSQTISEVESTHQTLLKEVKVELNKRIQQESEASLDNFQNLRKDLQKTESNLRETDQNLETQLKDTKTRLSQTISELDETMNAKLTRKTEDLSMMIHDVQLEQKGELSSTNEKLENTKRDLENTRKDLRETKTNLQKTTNDLLKTKGKLDDTLNELNKTKSTLEDTKAELELTGEDLKMTKEELEKTRGELDSTKSELDKTKNEQESRNLSIEGSLEKTKSFLDESHSQTEVKLQELNVKANDYREKMSKLKIKLRDTKAEIEEIKIESPVPCGFIYIQFAKQPDPNELWPLLDWMEVTEEYAGLFFRALGGNSAAFEVIQKQEIPRIATVTTSPVKLQQQVIQSEIPDIKGSTAPNYLFTGAAAKCTGDFWGMQFHVMGSEVRPRNTAIRIWKRILPN